MVKVQNEQKNKMGKKGCGIEACLTIDFLVSLHNQRHPNWNLVVHSKIEKSNQNQQCIEYEREKR